MISALVYNSIGVTPDRDAQLLAEPEVRWLGNINASYYDTRDLTPTPDVGNTLREDTKIDIPMLLVAGEWDWFSHPENVQEMRPFLLNAHVVTVEEGTHCTDWTEMADLIPEELEKLYSFVDADFTRQAPQDFFRKLPARAQLPKLRFNPPTGPSLYEQWLSSR